MKKLVLILLLGACEQNQPNHNPNPKAPPNHHIPNRQPENNSMSLPASAVSSPITKSTPEISPLLVQAARSQIGKTVSYDSAYTALAYPMGDVAINKGVCTDVVIRALREQKLDLQQEVHQDMKKHFSEYPKRWGLKGTDPNIDHRRVPNLMTFFTRQGWAVDKTRDFQAGDIVTWELSGNRLPHIGIVSDQKEQDTPLIIHNIGLGTKEENILYKHTITGHFRLPEKWNPNHQKN